ncbi:MAG TPA: hypothetical protein VFS97_10115 [Nitrososphaeraceae archaeon]|nr:hypothetical protein [Nitrososphaeraceae archaeon]
MAQEANLGIILSQANENVRPEYGNSTKYTAKHNNFRESIGLDLKSMFGFKTGQSYCETSDFYKKYTMTLDVSYLHSTGILSYGFIRF